MKYFLLQDSLPPQRKFYTTCRYLSTGGAKKVFLFQTLLRISGGMQEDSANFSPFFGIFSICSVLLFSHAQ